MALGALMATVHHCLALRTQRCDETGLGQAGGAWKKGQGRYGKWLVQPDRNEWQQLCIENTPGQASGARLGTSRDAPCPYGCPHRAAANPAMHTFLFRFLAQRMPPIMKRTCTPTTLAHKRNPSRTTHTLSGASTVPPAALKKRSHAVAQGMAAQ